MTGTASPEPPWAAEAALRYQAGEKYEVLMRDYRTGHLRLRRLAGDGPRLPAEGSARRRILARLAGGGAMTARALAEADGAEPGQRVLNKYGRQLRALRDDGWARPHELVTGATPYARAISYVITEDARQLMKLAAEAAARARGRSPARPGRRPPRNGKHEYRGGNDGESP